MTIVSLFSTTVIILVALYVWSRQAQKGRKRLGNRRPLSPEELYAAYYAGSDISMQDVRRAFTEIANLLEVPATILRPTDRFRVELAPEVGWEVDDGLQILSSIAERKLKAEGIDPGVLAQIETVDDYVRLFSGAQRESGG